MKKRALFIFGALIGCSGSEPATTDAAVDTPPDMFIYDEPGIPMTLTSPTITEGMPIPLTHVCANRGGQNQSPQLTINNVPSGTMSFAVVLTDLSNQLVHCAIYDVPSSTTTLPANIDKNPSPTAVPGAKQTPSYNTNVIGYNGPCPGSLHTYQFKVYALGAATLSGITTKESVVTAASASNLGTATLTGTFTP
ncbi:MAG TPA: YbhB/YbcL family Raf kinase inhibitor-like protein [Kofleriaceae bacterium]|nr:YbhB/YbcL family Raf kinase inhibitor-like protein [Kofleriaceae bacterium]